MRAKTRSAAPIHRAVFQANCPLQSANLRKPTGHEGTDKELFETHSGFLEVYRYFVSRSLGLSFGESWLLCR